MEDYLKELSEIPWINVVESVRAFDEYIHDNTQNRIVHITFAIMATSPKGAQLLEQVGRKIVFDYVFDTVLGTANTDKYPWFRREGESVQRYAVEALEFMIAHQIGLDELVVIGKTLQRDERLWLSVRCPFKIENYEGATKLYGRSGWEIENYEGATKLYGRFGCGVFHKDAKLLRMEY